mgnify:CR=1 FL=1
MAVIRRRWTRNELITALYLYGELPFGSFDQRNVKVQKYSALIDRTPSSLAMKLSNFASLDPMITSTGRKGLEGASKADKLIWAEMNSNWSVFTQEMLEVVSSLTTDVSQVSGEIIDQEGLVPLEIFVGREREVHTRARVGQNVFRKFVLSSYNFKCCISELSVPRLLVASHIVPWKDDEDNRLNPRNGLCLSMIHDKAFDLGMITVTEDLKVRVSSNYHSENDKFFQSSLSSFDGKSLVLPNKFSPDKDFLTYHRDVIFESKANNLDGK